MNDETIDDTQEATPSEPKLTHAEEQTPESELSGGGLEDFTLDGAEEIAEAGVDAPEQPEEEDAPFELDEGIEAPSEEFLQLYEEQARAAGLTNKQAASYISGVLKAEQAANTARLEAQKAELVKEWGAEYQANVRQAKSFAVQLANKAGVPREAMGVFASPYGFKLLHALRSAMGEPRFSGGKAAPQRSAAEEAEAMISDPNNPYYAAMYDPSHPDHRKAHERYDKLTGIV